MPSHLEGTRQSEQRSTANNAAGLVLDKQHRLRKRAEFLRIQKNGRKRHSRHFIALSLSRSSPGDSRIGLTVSRKVGNAVVRNRIKRRLREFFRHHPTGTSSATDIVVVAKEGAGKLSYAQLVEELGGLLGA